MVVLRAAALVMVGGLSRGNALQFDIANSKNRPVSKVITLLKDMQKQMEKEQEEDEEIYDRMNCWCQTNDREKTKAIEDAEVRIQRLTTAVEEGTANSARLGTEIDNLSKEVAKNQGSLAEATELRTKQLAEFNGEEKDLLESISALKSAVTVLSKHHEGFLQMPRSHWMALAAALQNQMDKHQSLLEGVLTRSERKAVGVFVQQPYQSYNAQSGQIFGILKTMQETFETNLAATQKDESHNQKMYMDLKAAKEAEIKAGQDQQDTKTGELATTDEKIANDKGDKKDTEKSLTADGKFLSSLKERCQMTDQEWEERQKNRQDEIQAVSQALAVLADDDAHDLFSKTFNFLQMESRNGGVSDRRSAAAKVLSSAAVHLHAPRLATLAYQVKLDAFVRVKKAIDDMVGQLIKEKEDEIKHKDFCIDEFNSNQGQTETAERDKKDIEGRRADLDMSIEDLTNSITDLNAGITEMQVQLKRAGEDREKENKLFQTTIADQRQTQTLLGKALKVLKGFYEKKDAEASLLQQESAHVAAGPPAPAGFSSYKKNAGSGGVLSMLQQIITDAKAMETSTIRSEEDAQKAYEDFVKNTNLSVGVNGEAVVTKGGLKAEAEGAAVQAKEDLESANLQLEQFSNYNAQLHQSCDFIQKNFEVRQTGRDEEIEALRQAKAILSGAKFEELLQQS